MHAPPGLAVSVVSFTVQGMGGQVIAPGSGRVVLTSPATGLTAGTLVLDGSGAFTFTPAPDYIGPAPAVSYTAVSSDGQSAMSALTVDVVPRAVLQPGGCAGITTSDPSHDTLLQCEG